MRCVLAVDSGGTKCDALLARDDGLALGWGHADRIDGADGRISGGSGRSPRSVTLAVAQALDGHECDEIHLATHSKWLPSTLSRATRDVRVVLRTVHEYEPAYALAGETAGVVAHAGTGAFLFGATRDGRALWLDGVGPILGDYGSGHHIGLMALQAAARAGWHPRHRTAISRRVYEACGLPGEDPNGYSLFPFLRDGRDRAEVAALARIVAEEADRGDAIARRIVAEAAAALAETLRDLVGRLDLAGETYPLIASGGIARGCDLYWNRFCELAREIAPALRPVRPALPAVVGVALIALRRLAPADRDAVEARLRESAPAVMAAGPPEPSFPRGPHRGWEVNVG